MSKPEPVYIAITIDSFIFPEKCKVRYETHVNVDNPSLTKINNLMECLKCGINAFEDEEEENDEDSRHKRYVLYEKYNKLLANLYDDVNKENDGENNE